MNRLLSMTSFGKGEKTAEGLTWTVEVRSVNHRYCDIHLKMSRQYAALEERIKKEIAAYYTRGHIDVTVNAAGHREQPVLLEVNLPLAREYHEGLLRIQRELGLPQAPDLALLASFRDIIAPVEGEEDPDAVWPPVREALAAALEQGLAMRRQEGAALRADLLERLARFGETVGRIEAAVPDLAAKKQAQLQERLDNLLAGVDIDPARLAQEVALMADKADVTEELVRLRSHIVQFGSFLDSDEPVGRRLDFLLQEFLREINTLASKISDAAIAHQTVELKNEVEKMREQVQNLE
ncbi:MAG: YicC family protein [Desulfobacteraceae bacterium]|nr:YicC family protein [Desulfobacteraceae bacterium]